MSVETAELSQYEGKKVILVVDQGEGKDALELEGTATSANALGVLLKPKGKTKLDIYEPGQIIDIRLVTSGDTKMKRKALKPVKLGQARSHLLERHAFTLAEVNDLSEEEAFTLHNEIDHEGDDLGHLHQDKSETPAAQAVADKS